jgi:exosortase
LLVFMIPLPYRLERAVSSPLQRLTTLASTYALQTLGLPALAEGNTIILEEFHIRVVETCSGLSMLVFFFALSTAVAMAIQRPLWEKLVIAASALPVAVIANVARVSATGVMYEVAGAKAADVFFHDLAGWLMMPLALGILWLQLKCQACLFLQPAKAAPVFFSGPGNGGHPKPPGPAGKGGDNPPTRQRATRLPASSPDPLAQRP